MNAASSLSEVREPQLMGGMLSTARMDRYALLTYTIGLKPFMDDIDIISVDPHEVPVDFHHVYAGV